MSSSRLNGKLRELSLWAIALAGVFTQKLVDWLGAPTFTGASIQKTRRVLVGSSIAFNTDSITYGIPGGPSSGAGYVGSNASIGNIGLELGLDMLPSGAVIDGIKMYYERQNPTGGSYALKLCEYSSTGAETVLASTDDSAETQVGATIQYYATLSPSATLDQTSKAYALRLTGLNDATALLFRFQYYEITYSLPNLESSL